MRACVADACVNRFRIVAVGQRFDFVNHGEAGFGGFGELRLHLIALSVARFEHGVGVLLELVPQLLLVFATQMRQTLRTFGSPSALHSDCTVGDFARRRSVRKFFRFGNQALAARDFWLACGVKPRVKLMQRNVEFLVERFPRGVGNATAFFPLIE